MAPLCECKLLVCMALLVTPPALAGQAKADKTCPENEVKDEQEEPECCDPFLMIESAEGKVCMEQPSDVSSAVAITLILSFTFFMSLQFFMNHSDEDMREYAYTVISATVSIFTAVLAFQVLDDLGDDFIKEPLQKVTGLGNTLGLALSFIQVCLWFTITQVTIAHVSCAFKSDAWRKKEIAAVEDARPSGETTKVMLKIKTRSVSFGMVLAHLTGFASIKFWTELQQVGIFRGSPLLTLVPLPFAVLVNLGIERVTDTCRESYISHRGDHKDWFQKTWDEECQTAEDDIMGLTLSVLVVNSLRFAINESYGQKCMPNSEQKEEGPQCQFERSIPQALSLLALGLLFVLLLFSTKLVISVVAKQEEDTEEDEDEKLIVGHSVEGGLEQNLCAEIVERIEDVTMMVWGMAYAWCVYHGARECLIVMSPTFLGLEQNAATLAVVLAFGVTYLAFFFIRVLDMLADLPDEWTPREVDESIKIVIRATSIFIGFAWEQTFDESIDELAKKTQRYGAAHGVPHAPVFTKFVMASFCIGIVWHAWTWFILPFVFQKGWRFGYIFSKDDLRDRLHELAVHDKEFSLEHLHEATCKLAAENDEEHIKRRFTIGTRLSQIGNYRSLPGSEAEATREKIQELKIYTRYLEEQLAEERKAGEEWKTHRRFLERQLAEKRKSEATESSAESSAESSVESSAESTETTGNGVNEHVQRFNMASDDEHHEDECDVDDTALTASIRANSPPELLSHDHDAAGHVADECVVTDPRPFHFRSLELAKSRAAEDERSQVEFNKLCEEWQEFGSGRSKTPSARGVENGAARQFWTPGFRSSSRSSITKPSTCAENCVAGEKEVQGDFKKQPKLGGQKIEPGRFAAASNQIVEDGAGQGYMTSASRSSSRSFNPRSFNPTSFNPTSSELRKPFFAKEEKARGDVKNEFESAESGELATASSHMTGDGTTHLLMTAGSGSPSTSPFTRRSKLAKPFLAEEKKAPGRIKTNCVTARSEFGTSRSLLPSTPVIKEDKSADCHRIHQGLREISAALQKLDSS